MGYLQQPNFDYEKLMKIDNSVAQYVHSIIFPK